MLEQLDIVKFIVIVVNYLNFDGERFCNVDVICFLFIFSLVCLFYTKSSLKFKTSKLSFHRLTVDKHCCSYLLMIN